LALRGGGSPPSRCALRGMPTIHETHDQIVDRVAREQHDLHHGVSHGVQNLGREEARAG
jgi:hypothetical protein